MTDTTSAPGYLRADDCRLEELVSLLASGRDHDLSSDAPADRLEQGVVVYESATLRTGMTTDAQRNGVLAEVARALASGLDRTH